MECAEEEDGADGEYKTASDDDSYALSQWHVWWFDDILVVLRFIYVYILDDFLFCWSSMPY